MREIYPIVHSLPTTFVFVFMVELTLSLIQHAGRVREGICVCFNFLYFYNMHGTELWRNMGHANRVMYGTRALSDCFNMSLGALLLLARGSGRACVPSLPPFCVAGDIVLSSLDG